MLTVVDQLPRLGERELICLLLFTCNYVVSVWRGVLFLWVLGMGYIILLWHSLSLHIIILKLDVLRLFFLVMPAITPDALLLFLLHVVDELAVYFACFIHHFLRLDRHKQF